MQFDDKFFKYPVFYRNISKSNGILELMINFDFFSLFIHSFDIHLSSLKISACKKAKSLKWVRGWKSAKRKKVKSSNVCVSLAARASLISNSILAKPEIENVKHTPEYKHDWWKFFHDFQLSPRQVKSLYIQRNGLVFQNFACEWVSYATVI